ncbi:MAG: hypothetical protein WAR81_08535 [Pseudomonadales bacterium]
MPDGYARSWHALCQSTEFTCLTGSVYGKPIVCDGNGPVNMRHQWYRRFRLDIADAGEELVKHKEHVTRQAPR